MKTGAVVLMFCVIAVPAWGTADDDPDGHIDPESNARVQQEIAKRDDALPRVPKLICHRVRPTGSHRSIKICRTPKQIEDDRAAARDILHDNTAKMEVPPTDP